MFFRISRGHFNPETETQVTRLVEDMLVPAIRALPGFQHYYGGVSRNTGMLVAVSQWDTEEHANFPREALAGVVPALIAIGVSLQREEVYDMLVDV